MAYSRISDANEITARYMDSILIKERLIDSVVADTSIEMFGAKFSSPVMTPAFSHLKEFGGRELTGLEEYSIAAKNLNILNFVGMMENDMFKRIADTGAKTVRIVKPYADNEKIRDKLAVVIDILECAYLDYLTGKFADFKRIFLARHRLIPFHIENYKFRAVCYFPAKHCCRSLHRLLSSFHYTYG